MIRYSVLPTFSMMWHLGRNDICAASGDTQRRLLAERPATEAVGQRKPHGPRRLRGSIAWHACNLSGAAWHTSWEVLPQMTLTHFTWLETNLAYSINITEYLVRGRKGLFLSLNVIMSECLEFRGQLEP